ncbi:MAG: hypothetical protein HUU54_00140 [Ignavibacteriaceae bacterium]|nr:hypothetical protein [Ignavibacteriaceae bacterium]
MKTQELKPTWSLIASVILIVNITGAALALLSFPETLYIAGFRFHIFAIILFISLALRKAAPDIVGDLRNIKPSLLWQFLLYFILLVLPVYLLYVFKLIKFADPDFLFELGASSLTDLPLYILWLAPLFYAAFIWYSLLIKLPWGRIFVFILGFLPFLYLAHSPADGIVVPEKLLYPFIYGIILSVAALSGSFYFFYFWAYIPLWVFILAVGTTNQELLQVLLAKSYEEWEGIFSLKGEVSEYKFYIYYAFCLLLLLINFFTNRRTWRTRQNGTLNR